jgi:hypothetical protein
MAVSMEVFMSTQAHPKGGFANSVAMQLTAFAIVTAILLVLAWRYVW